MLVMNVLLVAKFIQMKQWTFSARVFERSLWLWCNNQTIWDTMNIIAKLTSRILNTCFRIFCSRKSFWRSLSGLCIVTSSASAALRCCFATKKIKSSRSLTTNLKHVCKLSSMFLKPLLSSWKKVKQWSQKLIEFPTSRVHRNRRAHLLSFTVIFLFSILSAQSASTLLASLAKSRSLTSSTLTWTIANASLSSFSLHEPI